MNILKKPIITEKSTNLVAQGFYTFRVDRKANKDQIQNAVEKKYKVTVLEVRTILMKGKSKKVGRNRQEIRGKSWKKALVKLKKGQKIPDFELEK